MDSGYDSSLWRSKRIKGAFLLSIAMNVSMLPVHQSVAVLNHNKHGIVALEKPEGVLSHPNSNSEKKPAILKAPYNFDGEYYFWKDEQGNEQKAWLLNRLDSPTSGVILLGLNRTIKDAVRLAFEQHTIKKIYYAIVKGCPKVAVGQWNQKLKQSNYTSKYRVAAKHAKTFFKVASTSSKNPKMSCLSLEPVTGRTHQLRIHCSDNRLPIIGDQTYGDFKLNRQIKESFGINRLCLHSESTTIAYQYNGRQHEFQAKSELPEIFKQLMQ
jgi:23S rRNA-/tRNA-specific pseudouridylate synthase